MKAKGSNTMNTLAHHKAVSLAVLMGSLLVLLARPLTLLFVSFNARSESPSSLAIYEATKSVLKMSSTPVAQAKPIAEEKDLRNLQLRSMVRDYTYTFTGHTFCSGQPCGAELRVGIEADGDDSATTINTRSDESGFYSFKVHFKSAPSQQLDWRITAISDRLVTAESHGRQILSDEISPTISTDITLH